MAGRLAGAEGDAKEAVEVVFRETIPSWEDELAEVRAGTATIVAGYRNRLLLGVMATELEPWKDRLDTLADTVKGTIEEMAEDVPLPDRPEPEIDVDDDDWLYRSERCWRDQLDVYRANRDPRRRAATAAIYRYMTTSSSDDT